MGFNLDTDAKVQDTDTIMTNQIDTHIANLNDMLDAMDSDKIDLKKNKLENDVDNNNGDVEETEDEIDGKSTNEKEAKSDKEDIIDFNVEPNISIF